MKKLLLASVLAIASFPGCAAAGSAVCAVVLKTSDNYLALRNGPGVGHRLLEKLPRGEKIEMWEIGDNAIESAKRDAWVKVSYQGNHKEPVVGWVSTKYIQTFDCY